MYYKIIKISSIDCLSADRWTDHCERCNHFQKNYPNLKCNYYISNEVKESIDRIKEINKQILELSKARSDIKNKLGLKI